MTRSTVTCQGCSLLCDEMLFTTANSLTSRHGTACEKGSQWWQSSQNESPLPDATFQALIQRCTTPLVLGGTGLSIQAQAYTLEWLKQRNGFFDPEPGNETAQEADHSGAFCTLGELKQRSELVIFWGADPAQSHPRFFERFIDAQGRFLIEQRQSFYIGQSKHLSEKPTFQRTVLLEDSHEEITFLNLLLQCLNEIQPGQNNTKLTPIVSRFYELLLSANYPVVVFPKQISLQAKRLWKQLSIAFQRRNRLHLVELSDVPGHSWRQTQQSMFQQYGPCRFVLEGVSFDTYRYQASRLIQHSEVDCILVAGTLSGVQPQLLKLNNSALPIVQLPTNTAVLSLLRQKSCSQDNVSTYLRCDQIPITISSR